jgi:hypothetical protein
MSTAHAPDARLFDVELVIYRLVNQAARFVARYHTDRRRKLRLDNQPHPPAGPLGRENHPHGRGAIVDSADSARPPCVAAHRWRAQPRAPDHRAPSVPLAPSRSGTRRRPQGSSTLARAGCRPDRLDAEQRAGCIIMANGRAHVVTGARPTPARGTLCGGRTFCHTAPLRRSLT